MAHTRACLTNNNNVMKSIVFSPFLFHSQCLSLLFYFLIVRGRVINDRAAVSPPAIQHNTKLINGMIDLIIAADPPGGTLQRTSPAHSVHLITSPSLLFYYC